MAIFGNNTAYVAARAKSRKSNLMDRTRLRQLIQQSPDQLTVAVADNIFLDRKTETTSTN